MTPPLRVKRGAYLRAEDDGELERLAESMRVRRSAIVDEAIHRELARLQRQESRWRKPKVKRIKEDAQ
jgi:predicted transcriptional regulator